MARHVGLILIEGETEDEFYPKLLNIHATKASKKIKNLHGNFSIDKKIVKEAYKFSDNNPDDTFDVYVCIDQERIGTPAFNRAAVEVELSKIPQFKKLFEGIAVLMIESLFFIDIEGIFTYLKVPHAERNPQNYRNFRSLTHKDLAKLFRQYKREYIKGKRCAALVGALDLGKLLSEATELQRVVQNLNTRSIQ